MSVYSSDVQRVAEEPKVDFRLQPITSLPLSNSTRHSVLMIGMGLEVDPPLGCTGKL